jgi:hypothetical protein
MSPRKKNNNNQRVNKGTLFPNLELYLRASLAALNFTWLSVTFPMCSKFNLYMHGQVNSAPGAAVPSRTSYDHVYGV